MSSRVQVYLPRRAFDELRALAARRGSSTSSIARKATIQWLVSNGRDKAVDTAQGANVSCVSPKACRVHVRLPESVFARLAAVSHDFDQTPAGWTAALLAHALLDAPLARRDELIALRASTHQLSSVGVLLNQVARALNTQVKERGIVDAAAVPAGLIEQCRAEIRSVTNAVCRVIEANRQVYRRADRADCAEDERA
jgi:hypothetical protein